MFGVVYSAPTITQAQFNTTNNPQTEQQKIAALMQQINELRALLADLQQKKQDDTLYETFFFGTDFTAIYRNDDLTLTRIDAPGLPRNIHYDMWEHFIDVVGEKAAELYIDEFRVFNRSNSALGGFVEVKPHSIGQKREWVLAINSDDYRRGNTQIYDSYTDLFIHEYAHILLYETPFFKQQFREEFWSEADEQHAKNLDDRSESEIEELLEKYYDKNDVRFVSDYATFSPDEDMAESFTYFVYEDLTLGRDIISKKIRSFYSEPLFVQARNEIRRNIGLD